ncbi:MAG: hypothetical protein L0Z55_08935 [Planctomycetes bacterium]|nr:hypothetical protein [Planctomycetota bacterium]
MTRGAHPRSSRAAEGAQAGAPHETESPAWLSRVRDLYLRVDAEVAPHQHLCELRGTCCDFRRSPHRLYATELEARYLLAERSPPAPEAEGLCPFWRKGLCEARAERPLGCRVYFCAPQWKERGEEIYERYHAELSRIALEEGVPYLYGEWVERLRPAREPAPAPPFGIDP